MAFQDLRRVRGGFSKEDILLVVVAFAAIAGLLALNIFLARVLPGGEWLFLRWSGARAFLFEGIEPYSTTIAERVQQLAYGRTAFSSEYGYVLNDPFYIVLLYSPLALFRDFSLARGIWMLFSEAAMAGVVVASLRLLDWRSPMWVYVSLFLFAFFSYFNLQALISNSPAVFLLLLYLSALLALRSRRDELAGGLLFLGAYQWEIGALFFAFILVFMVANKRWNLLTGFVMSMIVSLLVASLLYADWGLPYVRAVLSNWYRGAGMTFESIASFWFPDSRVSIGSVTSVVALGIVLLEWLGAVREHFRRILWVVSLTLAVTPLIGFPIFQANYVVFTFPLIMVLLLVTERWNRRPVIAGLLVVAVAFLVPFGLSRAASATQSRIYFDLILVLPPVAAIVGLYWMRWFAVRSPRTWFDQVGVRK